jgi:hypothetical protein
MIYIYIYIDNELTEFFHKVRTNLAKMRREIIDAKDREREDKLQRRLQLFFVLSIISTSVF